MLLRANCGACYSRCLKLFIKHPPNTLHTILLIQLHPHHHHHHNSLPSSHLLTYRHTDQQDSYSSANNHSMSPHHPRNATPSPQRHRPPTQASHRSTCFSCAIPLIVSAPPTRKKATIAIPSHHDPEEKAKYRL